VFFRVKSNLMGEDAINPPMQAQMASLQNMKRDTVKLNVDYRDPFGITKSVPRQLSEIDQSNAGNPRQVKAPKPQFVWPNMKYFGMIKKTGSRKPLAVVKIDGVQLMLRQGEEVFDGIYLTKIDREFIAVRYKNYTTEVWRSFLL
jgi:hypothetical protein